MLLPSEENRRHNLSREILGNHRSAKPVGVGAVHHRLIRLVACSSQQTHTARSGSQLRIRFTVTQSCEIVIVPLISPSPIRPPTFRTRCSDLIVSSKPVACSQFLPVDIPVVGGRIYTQN
jgi:hypothetical protein